MRRKLNFVENIIKIFRKFCVMAEQRYLVIRFRISDTTTSRYTESVKRCSGESLLPVDVKSYKNNFTCAVNAHEHFYGKHFLPTKMYMRVATRQHNFFTIFNISTLCDLQIVYLKNTLQISPKRGNFEETGVHHGCLVTRHKTSSSSSYFVGQ